MALLTIFHTSFPNIVAIVKEGLLTLFPLENKDKDMRRNV
jgi:hypothetical protein